MVTRRKPALAAPDQPLEFNVFDNDCPARGVLDRIADKWALLILDRLRRRPVRFNQLRREISGISQKVLSETLRKLERDGIVARQVFATVPVSVEYSLTDLGKTLTKIVGELAHWAERHMDSVLEAQRDYDSQRGKNASSSDRSRALSTGR
jgi:DNA-binding HxlR family transcriptional regulator